MALQLIRLALAVYRTPLRFRHLMRADRPLPKAISRELGELGSVLNATRLPETAAALDTTPERLQEAVRFFIQHSLLLPEADPYRILGVSRDCSLADLKRHHAILVRLFHPDRGIGSGEIDTRATARINEAYRRLRQDWARRGMGPEGSEIGVPRAGSRSDRSNQPIPLSRSHIQGRNRRGWYWGFAPLLIVLVWFLSRGEPEPIGFRMSNVSEDPSIPEIVSERFPKKDEETTHEPPNEAGDLPLQPESPVSITVLTPILMKPDRLSAREAIPRDQRSSLP